MAHVSSVVQHPAGSGVRVGEPAAVLLGARAGRADGAAVHRHLLLRLRVHGAERAARHHPAHRPHLPHPHTGAPPRTFC